jgi:hypothetical protein
MHAECEIQNIHAQLNLQHGLVVLSIGHVDVDVDVDVVVAVVVVEVGADVFVDAHSCRDSYVVQFLQKHSLVFGDNAIAVDEV